MSAPDATVHDCVFTFSYETYDDAVRREMMRPPDRILQTLMGSAEIGRLMVANPYRSLMGLAARELRRGQTPTMADPAMTLHQPVRLKRSDATAPGDTIEDYRRYDRSLRRAAERAGLQTPAVMTTNPLAAAFSPFAWAGPVTFFARDDWSSATARREYWPAFRAAYTQIANSETAVIAVSQQIIDRIEPRGPHAVVANGVDPTEWLTDKPDAPDWFAAIPGPRAVYVGTLDTRIDIAGLTDLADRRPDLSIVLMGPLPDPSYIAPLRRLSNVHVHPSVGRSELVATLRHADLCLVAHVRTPLTEAMSPLKVFEYLAAGCPVLSVDLPPIRGLGRSVSLVPSVSDFADVVDDCLQQARPSESEREQYIQENSWASRHQLILEMLTRG